MTQNVKTGTFRSFDGTVISYRISGRGKETILCFNGIGVAKWVWAPFENYFLDRFRIVTWDYRGHGLSGKPIKVSKASFNHLVDDALLLIEKLKIKKACLVGHSAGFQIALEVLRKRPGLAKGLVSCLGTPGKVLDTFMESFIGELIFDIGYILNAVVPEGSQWINTHLLSNPVTYQIGAALRLVNPAIAGSTEINKYLRHLTGMNFSLFNNLIATGSKLSAEDLLPKIKVPTLLIASEFDRFVPKSVTGMMHQKVKGSKVFTIKNGTHAALFEQPDIFNLLIERFLLN